MKRTVFALVIPTHAPIEQSLISAFCFDFEKALLACQDDQDCVMMGRCINAFTTTHSLNFWGLQEMNRLRDLVRRKRITFQN